MAKHRLILGAIFGIALVSVSARAQVISRQWVDSNPLKAIELLEADSALTEDRALLLAQAYWRSGSVSSEYLLFFIEPYEQSEVYGPSFLRIKTATLLSYSTTGNVNIDSTLSELLRRVHPDSLELVAYGYYLKGYIAYLNNRPVDAYKWYTSGLAYAAESKSYYEGVI